jgi:hypothetical protein
MQQPSAAQPGPLTALVPLVATTITVLLAVAALPSLVQQAKLRLHPEPAVGGGDVLVVARAASGRWILNGAPQAEEGLLRQLQARPSAVVAVRFQPSAGLASAEVAASLDWLQRHSRLQVLVEWPGGKL